MNHIKVVSLVGILISGSIFGWFIYKSYHLEVSAKNLRLASDTQAEIISDLDNDNQSLREKVERLEKELAECRDKLSLASPARVTVTCYNSEYSQTDSTPFITAFNWRVRPGIIAVSHDLLERGYVPGSKVYIKNFGVFTVGDLMNKRYTDRVDIWIPKDKTPFMRKNVLIVPVMEVS